MIRPRTAALAASFLWLAGCAHTPPPVPPPPPLTPAQALDAKVQTLSHRAQALLRAQDEQLWTGWTQGTPVDLAAPYAGNDDLFTPDSIHAIEAARAASADPRDRRALDHLHAYFVGEYLARATTEVSDAIAELDATLSFVSGGEQHRLRDLERLLANEKSAVKRARLCTDASPAIARLNQRISRRDLQLSALLKALGTTDLGFGAELREVDLDRLAALADALLSRTQAPYLQVMDRLAHAELQEPFSLVRPPDLPRLFRPEVVDAAFPWSAVLPRIEDTLAGMGIDLSKRSGFRLDDEARKGKSLRGLTLRVAPDDVRVSLSPTEGLHAQMTALHEMGHALHDTFIQEPRFELAKLGDPTLAEAFAQLFEDLAEDPTWLTQETGLKGDRLDRYRSAAGARRLFLLRREAAQLLFALAREKAPDTSPAQLYAPLLTRALGMPVNEEDAARALYEEDPLFGAADSLRAWVLAAQLSQLLATRFGAAWWRSPQAGALLRGLWAHGTALTPEELLQSLGAAGLDPEPLLQRLAAALKVPLPPQ